MKRMLSSLIVVAVVALATPSFAHPTIDKARDGFKTVIMSPLQVRDHVKAESAKTPELLSIPGGLLKGVFYMGKDIVTGTLDVATSPLEMVRK